MNRSSRSKAEGGSESAWSILYLEDDPQDVVLVRRLVAAEFPDCNLIAVATRDEFAAGLGQTPPDVILSDFTVPGYTGLDALALARERAPQVPFVFLSGTIGEERALAALRGGASDYVPKSNLARLPIAIRHARESALERQRRLRDERSLRELRDIIERSPEAIVVSDMDGRITLWNRGAARLYGLSAAQAVGLTSEQIFPGTELPHVQDARESTLETGEWRRELNVTTRDGRDIVVDVHMTLVRDAAGQPAARLSIATDITEKKKLEEKFLRAQRLECIGLLAAGIAHDFNNVLGPIAIAVELLRRRASDPSDIRVLDTVAKSAARGTALVSQIVGFARGVGGKPQTMPPGPLLEEVADIIQTSFPKTIVVDTEIGKDLWPIHANPTQIHQVLLNLALNARDAMLPVGGTLRFTAENCALDERGALALEGARPGRFLAVEVSDTGSGIKPEVLARIWEPFFTTKPEGAGTGLGLSTVRAIVSAHGGFVTVTTKQGIGTAFRVFLPAIEPGRNE